MANSDQPRFETPEDYLVEELDKFILNLELVDKPSFAYLVDTKQKTAVMLSKANPKTQHLYGDDIIVSVNCDIFDKLDEDTKNILLDQAFAGLSMDKKGNPKLNRPDLVTYKGVVEKHGVEKVHDALELEALTHQQNEDKKKDDEAAEGGAADQ